MRVAIDTNLMILLIVGTVRMDLVGQHRRLKNYRAFHYESLVEFVSKAHSIAVTPNVLTETSNLIVQGIEGSLRVEILNELAAWADNGVEVYVPSAQACARDEYARLGLTDVTLLELCRDGATLLTHDGPLYDSALRSDYAAVHFASL